MKRISEEENNLKEELSQEVKITDRKIKVICYISIIMVIITPLIIAFVWYFIESLFFYLILIGIPIGIVIEFYGLYGIIMYRLISGKIISEEDKDLKINYYKSLLMVIFTPIIAILASIYTFTGFALGVFSIIPIGIVICLYGLYGIYSYKFQPIKYKKAIKNGKNKKIKYYLLLVASLPIFMISSYYITGSIYWALKDDLNCLWVTFYWLIAFIPSLIGVVLGFYKSIHERRIYSS
ncbi:MAG: hypothetical protein ACFFCE_05565 [Promethearchaeota archaeon]